MYKLLKSMDGQVRNDCVLKVDANMYVPFDPANTDYQQFLQHLAQGLPVESADGTAMTESEIAALYQTLTQPNT